MNKFEAAAVRGMVAQLLVEAYSLECGWDCYRPVREDGQCDILLDRYPQWGNPFMERVQVKRCYLKDGHRTINLKRKNGARYDVGQIDLIAAVDCDTREIWLIPFEKLWDKKHNRPLGRLRLTKKWADYILEPPK